MSPPPAYDELVGRLDYPMAIVTTAAGGDRAGDDRDAFTLSRAKGIQPGHEA